MDTLRSRARVAGAGCWRSLYVHRWQRPAIDYIAVKRHVSNQVLSGSCHVKNHGFEVPAEVYLHRIGWNPSPPLVLQFRRNYCQRVGRIFASHKLHKVWETKLRLITHRLCVNQTVALALGNHQRSGSGWDGAHGVAACKSRDDGEWVQTHLDGFLRSKLAVSIWDELDCHEKGSAPSSRRWVRRIFAGCGNTYSFTVSLAAPSSCCSTSSSTSISLSTDRSRSTVA